MESKKVKQPIPEELKEEQLDMVAAGQDIDAATMEKLNAARNAIINDLSPSQRPTLRLSIVHNVYMDHGYVEHESIDNVRQSPAPERPSMGIQNKMTPITIAPITIAPEDELWTKK